MPPIQYVVALGLLVGLGMGIYKLRASQTTTPSRAATPVGAARAQATAPASATTVIAALPARTTTAPRTVTAPSTRPAVKRAAPGRVSVQALLDRARLTYTRVPGVLITNVDAEPGSITVILRGGRVEAAAIVANTARGMTQLVERRGSPTFVSAPGTRCWLSLPAANPPGLAGMGAQFPPAVPAGAIVGKPRTIPGGWLVDVNTNTSEVSGLEIQDTPPIVLVRSLTTTGVDGQAATLRVTTLGSAPSLPTTEPRC
jgi:hypothetical protein